MFSKFFKNDEIPLFTKIAFTGAAVVFFAAILLYIAGFASFDYSDDFPDGYTPHIALEPSDPLEFPAGEYRTVMVTHGGFVSDPAEISITVTGSADCVHIHQSEVHDFYVIYDIYGAKSGSCAIIASYGEYSSNEIPITVSSN